jgi:hypothetical protein
MQVSIQRLRSSEPRLKGNGSEPRMSYSYRFNKPSASFPGNAMIYRPGSGGYLATFDCHSEDAAKKICAEFNKLLLYKGDILSRLFNCRRIADGIDLAMEWLESNLADNDIQQVDELLSRYNLDTLPVRTQTAILRTTSRARDKLPHWEAARDRAYAVARKELPVDADRLFRGLL